MQTRKIVTMLLTTVSLLLAMSVSAETDNGGIDADSFKCLSDLTPVGNFFVDNLNGDIDATIKVANSGTGDYPAGSVVQLVPTEAMVKREAGFNAATKDWEFFELSLSKEKTAISTRGFTETVNRFGGNCFGCHVKARPEFDLICKKDQGCDPLPFTHAMITAIQKTDPRCAPVALSTDEMAGLKALAASMGGGDKK